jgi:hypothetical protein
VAQLDRLKEEIGYRKLWLGLAVASDISIGGWLVTSASAATVFTIVLAIGGVIFLGIGAVVLDRQIERRITRIGRL